MEGNNACWAPFSALLTALPMIGSDLLYTAAFFIDAMSMKFASFRIDDSANLKKNPGWGNGGSALYENLNVADDTARTRRLPPREL